jgi:hypothetical protein
MEGRKPYPMKKKVEVRGVEPLSNQEKKVTAYHRFSHTVTQWREFDLIGSFSVYISSVINWTSRIVAGLVYLSIATMAIHTI